jgi:hypothetical protein
MLIAVATKQKQATEFDQQIDPIRSADCFYNTTCCLYEQQNEQWIDLIRSSKSIRSGAVSASGA